MGLLSRALKRRRNDGPVPVTIDQQSLTQFNYLREQLLPRPADVYDQYVPSKTVGRNGIDFHESEQLTRIKSWRSEEFQSLYRTLRDDTEINVPFGGKSYLGSTCLHNGWYPTPDAEIYASMIYERRPDQIVEVGSGFSTLIARRALQYARHEAPLTVIDPAPRTDVERAADQVIYQPVEESRLEDVKFTSRSLLFIDSSHITRPRGDGPYLYCRVLPQLPAGMLVHVHDVFTPHDYPTCYDHLGWTEQYLLQALLSHSPRYHTVLATHFLSRAHTAEMQATFGPQVGADNLFYGASYWFEVR